jgi:hypothetical protein
VLVELRIPIYLLIYPNLIGVPFKIIVVDAIMCNKLLKNSYYLQRYVGCSSFQSWSWLWTHHGLQTMDQLFKSNLTFCVVCVFNLQTGEWCVHNLLFNANFEDKFKWIPDTFKKLNRAVRGFSKKFTIIPFCCNSSTLTFCWVIQNDCG